MYQSIGGGSGNNDHSRADADDNRGADGGACFDRDAFARSYAFAVAISHAIASADAEYCYHKAPE